jgi:hypothetical protein
MARMQKRGPGAKKVELEKRLDANAKVEKKYFAGRDGKDAGKARKASASSGARDPRQHGKVQRGTPYMPKHPT